MMEWQPIETAPRDGTEFLGWNGVVFHVAKLGWYDNGPVWWNGDYSVSLTHWMPLPAAPTPVGAA